MEGKAESIIFENEEGEEISFFVVEETRLAGVNYLLVADSEEEEAEAYILKEVTDDEKQSIYEMVDDEEELEALSKVFAELLDDIDLE